MSGPILEDLLAEREHVLLDFDGPICAIFGTLTDSAVADQLRAFANDLGVDQLPEAVRTSRDPFDVLTFMWAAQPQSAQRVHEVLTRLELEAVATAPPTPGADEAVRRLSRRKHTVTIVSNNSLDAVSSYVESHHLADCIAGISARTTGDPSQLKPAPFLLLRAMRERGATEATSIMIGDSTADIKAARSAGIPVVAFANRPAKRDLFAALAPDATISTMSELAALAQP